MVNNDPNHEKDLEQWVPTIAVGNTNATQPLIKSSFQIAAMSLHYLHYYRPWCYRFGIDRESMHAHVCVCVRVPGRLVWP